MNHRWRWALAAVVIVIAAAVALWPRDHPGPQPTAAPDLAAARASADLQPCTQSPPRTAGADELRPVRAVCLATGQPVELGAVLGSADRPVLINIWATWCEPCRTELPVLAQYASRPGAARVVGVAVRSDQAGALQLLTALGVRYPNVIDDGSVLRALRVPDALPATYLVGVDGSVRFVTSPRLLHSLADVTDVVAKYGGKA